MGQVRWAGWTMAIAAALVSFGGQPARADIASDKPASIVVYPKVVVDSENGIDTMIRLSNTNTTTPINVHCFYVDATASGQWSETDFNIVLTAKQPLEWRASDADVTTDNSAEVPLPVGVCIGNQRRFCGVDADCLPVQLYGGVCTQSNAGTLIPPVAEDPFAGELTCIATDPTGTPISRNELKGEALIETATEENFDVASYNAIGIQATAAAGTLISGPDLTLGPGSTGEYNGCPEFLILNHFFDLASDPVPRSENTITTDITLVPCSDDYLRQIPGAAVVQYLVFNEFEQRFSTSKTADCYQDIQICNLDTPQCNRSIFSVGVAGTLTGQTRLNPIGISSVKGKPRVPSGLLGVAVEHHGDRSAAFNLHFQGARSVADVITIP